MGVLKRLTEEYFGETERKEDMIKLPEGVVRVDFTDRNGKRHRSGYRVENGSWGTLDGLIKKLIDKRGPECDLNDVDVSNVKDMKHMFSNSDFNGDISGWDVSGVTNMSYMFCGSHFNGDISEWDVSGVTTMYAMFSYSQFNGDISGWNVFKVTDMGGMFDTSKFTGENGDISGWDVNPDCDTRGMFDDSPLMNNPPEWYNNRME